LDGRSHSVPAYQSLLGLAHEERDRLDQQADQLWTTRDVHSRNEAPTRALVDPTKTGQLLNRYKSDAHRIEKQAIEELHRHRRQQSRDRSTPPPVEEVTRRPPEPPREPQPPQPLTPTPTHPQTNPSTPLPSIAQTPAEPNIDPPKAA
jgi:hypothetical protein